MNKADITVKKINESTIYIDTNNIISQEISNYFSAYAPNYRFHPLYKKRNWDGKIRVFDLRNNHLPIGLLSELISFAKHCSYTIHITFPIKNQLNFEEFSEFVDSLNVKVYDIEGNLDKIRDFQLMAAYDLLRSKHLNISSVTGSGKSLIIYLIVRWCLEKNMKIICIVNAIQLVEQMFGDFYSYGWEDVEKYCCRIYGGMERQMEKPVIISTWQSLYTDKEQFSKFDVLIIDEADLSYAKNISETANACINAGIRCGVSGTYPDEKTAEWLTIVGSTGPIKIFSTYKTLQDIGQLSKLKIYAIRLEYPFSVREENFKSNKKDYNDEIDYINQFPERTEFITKLISNLKGNTLILFTKKEKHGIPLFKNIKKTITGRKIYYIDGDTDIKDREHIRKSLETDDDAIFFASYGTFARGLSVKKIHNIIFASGYKKKGKILQSLGRGLRLHKTKEYLCLYDIVDDLIFKTIINIDGIIKKIKYENYSVKHFKLRNKIYNEQGFEIIPKSYLLKLKEKTK